MAGNSRRILSPQMRENSVARIFQPRIRNVAKLPIRRSETAGKFVNCSLPSETTAIVVGPTEGGERKSSERREVGRNDARRTREKSEVLYTKNESRFVQLIFLVIWLSGEQTKTLVVATEKFPWEASASANCSRLSRRVLKRRTFPVVVTEISFLVTELPSSGSHSVYET